ncbi:ATP-binding protein [Gammaproteobacteria bacterium AB-CW1]|uniref:histidine kinase n=1 Tax=Natronospira elongata TaxID=3110268 RepID=A0AAP6JH24_9GAMM|nr:ATP-binding protein [Gammaproteobacteria bacterium AB-CW1]
MSNTVSQRSEERNIAADDLRWRSLRLLNGFRLALGAAMLLGYLLQPDDGMLGSLQPWLFLLAAASLVLLSAIAGVCLRLRRPRMRVQAFLGLLADSSLFMVILHASGGLETGLGNLLFIPVAAASLLLGRRTAITLAALITLILLGQQILIAWSLPDIAPRFTQAGILGALFMLLALVGAHLSRQLRESEALAVKRGLDLRNLSELNDYIIHHLRTGIVVVDHRNRVQLMNGTAAQFLGVADGHRDRPVDQVSAQLSRLVRHCRETPYERPASFVAADGETVVVPQFTELGDPNKPGTLLFLEDGSLQGQRAQEMKLAALGRFTASIAHELRNPLGAISHSNQLLMESEALTERERRLGEIIDRHAGRLNRIIETVLKLSRREATEPERLDLSEWLRLYQQEMLDTGRLKAEQMELVLPDRPVEARMDDDHLRQIVDNLVDNARRHGGDDSPVRLSVSLVGRGDRPNLEVSNPGEPIPDEEAGHIFEPFYTASPRGTGLGLFMARELCDCNRAKLEYRYREGRNCFRVIFADPERWIT